MRRTSARSLLGVGLVILLQACSAAPSSETARENLHDEAQVTIARFEREDPMLAPLFGSAYGYAVFPTVAKGGAGLGGAYGRGEVYEQGVLVGFCDLSQGSIGFQLGGQTYSQIIFFQDKRTLDRFRSGEFALAAQASAVAVQTGMGGAVNYRGGVAIYTLGETGLMYEASVGGQKFDYEPL